MIVANRLREFHNFFQGSIRWRLTPEGVSIEYSGVERTPGKPTTVTRIWETYNSEINKYASKFDVPVELILATICTESGGNPKAVREEPGFVSDTTTPSKISAGLMQTLLSTAAGILGVSRVVTREWLQTPGNSIEAGTAYIAHQIGITGFDPPLVAAAYNAGGLYMNNNESNRWRLRMFPIGTSEHVDRFVKWFNDAIAVMKAHPTKPFVSFTF